MRRRLFWLFLFAIGLSPVLAEARRLHIRSFRVDLPAGQRREGIRFLQESARKQGVALAIVPLRAGRGKTLYGIKIASLSMKRLAAFEQAAHISARPTARSIRLGVA